MGRLGMALVGLAVVAGSGAIARPEADKAAVGRRVFEHNCAPCHGKGLGIDGSKMLPGTATLTAKYKGELPGALEDRSDLTAETLLFFVRNGSGAMPMFRKTEVSDAEVDAVAAYLAGE